MSATNAFQAFLVQTLLADTAVSAIAEDRIWDDVPSVPIHPYCSVGPNYHNRNDSDCIRGRDHYFQIDCFTDQQGRRDQVNDLTDAIEHALNDASGDLGVHALVSCNVVLVRVQGAAEGKKHGIVQVHALIEEG